MWFAALTAFIGVSCGVIVVDIDGGVELVQEVDPAVVGMKGKMAWPGAMLNSDGGGRVGGF